MLHDLNIQDKHRDTPPSVSVDLEGIDLDGSWEYEDPDTQLVLRVDMRAM